MRITPTVIWMLFTVRRVLLLSVGLFSAEMRLASPLSLSNHVCRFWALFSAFDYVFEDLKAD